MQSEPCRYAIAILVAGILIPARILAQTETMLNNDASGTSSLTGVTNWTPATTVSPTNIYATTNVYIVNDTFRTPGNALSYTSYAAEMDLVSGATMAMKGYDNCVITISNLVLSGGQISQGENGHSPETQILAGNINFTTSTTITSGATGAEANNALTLIIQSAITNDGSSYPTLTLSDNTKAVGGLTVVLAGRNTFYGGITLDGIPGDTLKLGADNALPPTTTLTFSGTVNPAGTTNNVFDLAGYSTVISNLVFTLSSNSGIVTNSSTSPSTLTISNSAAPTLQYGVIADNAANGGTLGLTVAGGGVLTIDNAETYSGDTTISAGTLALDNSGSISNSAKISIAAGATFDVSAYQGANSEYTLGSSTSLDATGDGTISGTNAATINGAGSGFPFSFGGQPVILTFTPTAFNGDATHPSLVVSQSDLALNNNTFYITNASGTALGPGTYQLIQVTDGNITQNASPAYAVTVLGSGIAANTSIAIQVAGGDVNLVVSTVSNPSPTFSNLTPNPSVIYGTSSVTLSGRVSHGTTYPASGELVDISINGNLQSTTIDDNTGDFSINYDLTGVLGSAPSYTITYSYSGDGSLGPASDTSTTLTVQKATPVFSNLTASRTDDYGTPNISLGGTVSVGSVYPSAGEAVTVTINGIAQSTTITDGTGDFSITYNTATVPGGVYPIVYSYGGDPILNGATNSSTTLTVQTNTIIESLAADDLFGYSSLTTSNNWNPPTVVYPTDPSATNYIFVVEDLLRTPSNNLSYTAHCAEILVTNGGTFDMKGYGNCVITVSNMVLAGGSLSQGVNGISPETQILAGNINVTTNSIITSAATQNEPNNALTLIIQSVISSDSGSYPILTMTDNNKAQGGLTVVMAAQNTFNGGITLDGIPGDTLQLGCNNALPATTLLTFEGNVTSEGTTNNAFDLAGYSTAISNLIFTLPANSGYVTNSSTSPSTLTISNNADSTLQYGVITDNGANGGTLGLTMAGSGILTIGNAETYYGNTTISAGTLALNGSGSINNSAQISVAANTIFDVSQTSFDLGANQILTGSGAVNGSMQADGTVWPFGTLTFSNDLTINGNLNFTLNTSLAQPNDVVNVGGTLENIGTGTLTVSNLGPGLVAGETFYLFNQPLIGGNNLTIVPPAGVVLTNTLAVNGALTVVSVSGPPPQPHITSVSLQGTSLVIRGTNGVLNEQYNILMSTNLALPLSEWTVLPTNTLNGGNFSLTNTVDPTLPHSYFILRVP